MPNGWPRCRAEATLSLYIHVPFCTELCFYCGCNTRAVRKREPIDAYAERLIDEIKLLDGLQGPQAQASALGRRHALDPRAAMAGDHRRAARLAVRPVGAEGTRHRARSAPARPPAGAHACARSASTAPASACRTPRPHVQRAIGRVQPFELVERAAELAARGRHRRPQYRSDVRPARADRARRGAQRRACRFARAAAPGAVRLCPCAVVQDPSAADRRGRAARPERAAGAGAGRRPRRCKASAIRRSASTISPSPTTRWRSPRANSACTAISRATPPTTPTR